MKKLLLSLVAFIALALTSCGSSSNNTTPNEANVDSLANALEQAINAAADSASIINAINQADSTIKALEITGDTAALKAYKWKLKEFIDNNKEKFEGVSVPEAISEIANIDNLARQITEAAKTDAQTATSDAQDAAKTAVETNQKVVETKEKIEEAQKKAEETKQTIEDVKSAAQSAKDALSRLKKQE
ncbi:MAG: hypothetical protein ACI308_05540 [Muribaculaceae bacterium]